MNPNSERRYIKELRKELAALRQFPTNTTPASRHLEIIADALAVGEPYAMLTEDPKHCAITMYSVLIGFYRRNAPVISQDER